MSRKSPTQSQPHTLRADSVLPLDSGARADRRCTKAISLNKVTRLLAFAKSINAYRLVESIPFDKFGTSYDRRVGEAFREAGVELDESPFDLGEVSFHHNLSFHTAGPNLTNRSRIVLANTYFANGACLVDEPTMVSGDWEKFAPGIPPGGRLATPVNPICWPPENTAQM